MTNKNFICSEIPEGDDADRMTAALPALLERYPQKPTAPWVSDEKPGLYTAETARESIETNVGLHLRMPYAYARSCKVASDVRDRLNFAGVWPHYNPDEDPDQAGWVHNMRQVLIQLAEMLPAADVIAMARLGEKMLMSPPDAADFAHTKASWDVMVQESRRVLTPTQQKRGRRSAQTKATAVKHG
jgi:hypothetical protein